MSLYNLQGSIYNQNFSLTQTWPWFASKPIPLSIITAATLDSSEGFYDDILSRLANSAFAIKDKLVFDDTDKKYICGLLYESMLSVSKYCVHCNHLPLSVIEREDVENTIVNVEEKSNLEILFERINVNGTRISNEDLNYSSIKAYWEEIRDVNDSLAARYMAPAKLAMLAFRLCLTEPWSAKFHDINLTQIRKLSLDKVKKDQISQFYVLGDLECVLNRVDEWLGVNQEGKFRTPAILRTIIAHKCSELYLLLMYWAKLSIESPDNFMLSSQEIRATAFTIRWFGNDANAIVRELMTRTSRSRCLNLEVVQMALNRCMHDCSLLHIYSPDDVETFFTIEQSPKWSPYNHNSGKWREFFWRITAGYGYDLTSEMIIYSQRGYINTHFSNYDPARQDMWEGYNRPWDYDHIVPQSKVNKKHGPYREYDQFWLNTMGNIAAISYEANRSKNDRVDYGEYVESQEDLLFDPIVENLTDDYITYNAEQSFIFAKSSFSRLVKVYRRIYKMLTPVIENMVLSPTLQLRKEIIEQILCAIPSAKAYLVAGNNDEYEIERSNDWSREWLSVGVVKGDFYASFVWDARKDNFGCPYDVQIGIRKAPNSKMNHELRPLLNDCELLSTYDRSQMEWWYAYKQLPELNVDYIISELTRLISVIETI